MNPSVENYLKTIFSLCLTENKEVVKVSEISKRLEISVPAVTDMVRRLQADGYVINTPYKGLSLTPEGLRLGREVVRRHRLWEVYLHQELGLTGDKVHDEAERLEHACSDELVDIIDAKLNYPTLDPHGNPIPQKDGRIPGAVDVDL